jgi:predicted HTH domain antitoxin
VIFFNLEEPKMPVTIELPSEAEQTFREAWGDNLDRKAFEALIIQGYRERILSVGRIAELIGLGTSIQADQWLADRHVERNVDESDLSFDYSPSSSRSFERK